MRHETIPQLLEVRRLPEKTQREQNELFIDAAKRDFGWRSDLEVEIRSIEEGIIVSEAYPRANGINTGHIVLDELTDKCPERRVWMVSESEFWEFYSEIEVDETLGRGMLRYHRVILDVAKDVGTDDRFHTVRRSPEVVYELRFQADAKTVQTVCGELADFKQQQVLREVQKRALDDFLSRNVNKKLTKADLETMDDADKNVLSRQMWLFVLQNGGSLEIKDENREWHVAVYEKGVVEGEGRLEGIYAFQK